MINIIIQRIISIQKYLFAEHKSSIDTENTVEKIKIFQKNQFLTLGDFYKQNVRLKILLN